MRKISLVLLSIGALLGLSIYWQGPASADGMGLGPPEGFGKKIAGSWYDEFMHYPDGGDPWPGTGIVTFGADGTVTFSSIGPVGDQAGGGTWERTGQREITATVLIMAFAADPIVEDDDGNLVHSHSLACTGRSRIIFEFDQDFQTATGDGCTDAFAPGQDPLEDVPAYGTLPYVEHTCRKVNVVPCGLDDG